VCNDKHDNLFTDDYALDFMICEDFKQQDKGRKGGKSGCFGFVVLLLLPAARVIFLNWK
jgi:hypothetical protein